MLEGEVAIGPPRQPMAIVISTRRSSIRVAAPAVYGVAVGGLVASRAATSDGTVQTAACAKPRAALGAPGGG